MSSIIAKNEPSIFISHVYPNKASMVESVFLELFGSCIDKVDIVKQKTRDGEDICRAYIHFKWWPNTTEATTLRQKLLKGDTIKVVYEKTWFWKCVASKFKDGSAGASGAPRSGPYIEVDDEQYERVCGPDDRDQREYRGPRDREFRGPPREHRDFRGPPRDYRERDQHQSRDYRGYQRDQRDYEHRGPPREQREFRGPPRDYRPQRDQREFRVDTRGLERERKSSPPKMMPRQVKLKTRKDEPEADVSAKQTDTEKTTPTNWDECSSDDDEDDCPPPPPAGPLKRQTAIGVTEEELEKIREKTNKIKIKTKPKSKTEKHSDTDN